MGAQDLFVLCGVYKRNIDLTIHCSLWAPLPCQRGTAVPRIWLLLRLGAGLVCAPEARGMAALEHILGYIFRF